MGGAIGQALLSTSHTGWASATTIARNLSGNAFGVSTSTFTPSGLDSLCLMVPTLRSVHIRVRLDQNIQIAFLGIFPTQDRSKHPGIRCPIGADDATNLGTVQV